MARNLTGPHTEEDIEFALTQLAMCAGSPTRAAQRLEQLGRPISVNTLIYWKGKYPDRIERIHQEVLPQINAKVAQECEDLARKYAEVEDRALGAVIQALDEDRLEVKDIARLIQPVATSKAINVDKARLLRDRPTQIVEHRDVVAAIEKLERLGVWNPATAGEGAARLSESRPSVRGGAGPLSTPSKQTNSRELEPSTAGR